MSIKHGHFTLTALVTLAALGLAAVPAVATAQSFDCPVGVPDGNFDGHFYEVKSDPGITWDAAKTAAEGLAIDEVQGQLATINSPAEDEYIHCLIQATAGVMGEEAWVGGSQTTCAVDPEPGCGWTWLNGEAIAAANTSLPYTNWQANEPNDAYGPGSEQHVGVNLGGAFGWNDESSLENIGGYVVEYGDRLASIPASTCSAGGPGCPLGSFEGAQVIRFPPQAIVTGDLTATTFQISVACGRDEPLSLFDGAVVIPQYLCGEDVRVTKTLSEVEIPKGVVAIENTENNPFGCDLTFPSLLHPLRVNPTENDVVVWQTTDKAQMLETGFVTGVDPEFVGTVAEVTNGCINPSRGSGGKGSWFIEGLVINFGAGNADLAFNHMRMVALQRYKLELLRAAVVESKPSLKKIDWLALKVLVDGALYFHDRGNYDVALFKIKLFLKLVGKINYSVIVNENYNGEHTWRGTNIQDMYSRRLIPFAP